MTSILARYWQSGHSAGLIIGILTWSEVRDRSEGPVSTKQSVTGVLSSLGAWQQGLKSLSAQTLTGAAKLSGTCRIENSTRTPVWDEPVDVRGVHDLIFFDLIAVRGFHRTARSQFENRLAPPERRAAPYGGEALIRGPNPMYAIFFINKKKASQ